MSVLRIILVVVFLIATISIITEPVYAQTDEQNKVIGSWEGKLRTPGGQLRIVLHISVNIEGNLESTLDSPDQGATGIPVTTTTFENGKLLVAATSIGGAYDGKLSKDGQTLKGQWSQAGMNLPLKLALTDAPSQLNRPQEPHPPYPYNEEEVTFNNREANIVIAGTLTTPNTDGPFPAVILVSGSGPQDRNETLMGHKPFLVIADYLTQRGIAVLRYDDRGVGKSTGDFTTATTEDLATDAQAAVNFLKSHPQIKPSDVGVIGHSEGGIIAPMLGAKPDNVGFIVLLAGPGLPGYDILVMQSELMAKAQGLSDQLVESLVLMNSSLYRVIMDTDEENAEEAFNQKWLDMKREIGGETATMLGFTAGRDKQIFQQLSSPWFRFFMSYDPLPTLKAVKVPILSMIGEKDLQVPAEANTDAIQSALASVDHTDYTTEILPDLNHLFQTANTGGVAEYGTIEETFAPAALTILGDWIVQKTASE